MAWVVFGSLAFLHYINFRTAEEKTRGLARLFVTILFFGQCIGTIIQYLA